MQLKYGAIQATLENAPRIAMPQLALRIQDSEASLGEKVFLFETIGNAAVALSEQETLDGQEPSHTESTNKTQNLQQLHDQIMADNEFFRKEEERPIVLAGKITKRLKPTKLVKGKKNAFISIAP